MGAMENWGLVTYRDVDLLIDPLTASNKQKQRVCTVGKLSMDRLISRSQNVLTMAFLYFETSLSRTGSSMVW
jgi:hypothetical protein